MKAVVVFAPISQIEIFKAFVRNEKIMLHMLYTIKLHRRLYWRPCPSTSYNFWSVSFCSPLLSSREALLPRLNNKYRWSKNWLHTSSPHIQHLPVQSSPAVKKELENISPYLKGKLFQHVSQTTWIINFLSGASIN